MHVTRRSCYDCPMKFMVAFGVASCALVTAAVHAGSTQQATTTWSGVYTDAQAKVGQEAYAKACAECHGQDLAGDGYAPGLKGTDFMTNWSGLSVGELFDRIRVSMPPSNPNSVPAKEKADIVAYILKESGFPAGTTELPAAVEELKAIKIEANKPGR
jgi:mono/diheme cytochrome c family protein